jgi:hypothetical protein
LAYPPWVIVWVEHTPQDTDAPLCFLPLHLIGYEFPQHLKITLAYGAFLLFVKQITACCDKKAQQRYESNDGKFIAKVKLK